MVWLLLVLIAAAVTGTLLWLLRRDGRGSAPPVRRVAPTPAPSAESLTPRDSRPERQDFVTLDDLQVALGEELLPEPAEPAARQAVERLGLGDLPHLTRAQADLILTAHRLAEDVVHALTGLRDGYDGERRVEAILTAAIINEPEFRSLAVEHAAPKPKRLGRPPKAPTDPRRARLEAMASDLLSQRGS